MKKLIATILTLALALTAILGLVSCKGSGDGEISVFYHGIDRMVDEGEIVISVHEAADCPDDILITVSDNGIGMTEEQCRKILQKEKSDSGGIGVKNVNDRLKIWFGDRYGLTIRSVPDEGTTVTVRIPKVEKEEERL